MGEMPVEREQRCTRHNIRQTRELCCSSFHCLHRAAADVVEPKRWWVIGGEGERERGD